MAISPLDNNNNAINQLDLLYEDPITAEIMENPVIDQCGHTFDMSTIEEIIVRTPQGQHVLCPISQQVIDINRLIVNRFAVDAIDRYKEDKKEIAKFEQMLQKSPAFLDLKQNHEQLQVKYTKLEKENSEFKEENALIKNENTEFKKENALIKNENTEFKKENTLIKNENTELKNAFTEFKTENSAIKAENLAIKNEWAAINNNYIELKNQTDDLRSKFRQVSKAFIEIVKTNNENFEKLKKLEADNNRMKAEDKNLENMTGGDRLYVWLWPSYLEEVKKREPSNSNQ
jgi:hypothetical protein